MKLKLVLTVAIFLILNIQLKAEKIDWYNAVYVGFGGGIAFNDYNLVQNGKNNIHDLIGKTTNVLLGYSFKYLDTELKLTYKEADIEVKTETNTPNILQTLDEYNEKTSYISVVLKPSYTTLDEKVKIGLVFEVGFKLHEDNISLYKRELENVVYSLGVTYSYNLTKNHSIYTDILPIAKNTDSVFTLNYKYTFR